MFAAGAARALGVDIDETTVMQARSRYSDCEFARADLTQPFELSEYSVRVCFEAIEHVPDPRPLLNTIATGLQPDGVAIVSTPNGDEGGGTAANPHHFREYSRAEFQEMLEQHFRRVQVFFQWRYPDPFASPWTARHVLRAIMPLSLKHRLKGRHGPAVDSPPGARPPAVAGAVCRPQSRNPGLLPPGFRYRPSIWIGVCSESRLTCLNDIGGCLCLTTEHSD